MKLKHLLLTALMTVVGIGSSWADDIQDLKATGWTQVTELADVENNYYVFVDAGTGLYSIGRGLAAGDRPMSHVLGNPAADNSQVWILEGSGTTFKMKNLKDNYYFNSGNAGWNDSMGASNGTDFTFTLNEGKYDISATTGYVGPWNNDNKVALTDGAENIAVNKAANQAPGYYVFAMSRTAYDAAKFGVAQLEAQGWTKATDIANAVGDNFVIFLEAKGGSLVISRNESGRPAYKSLGNPLYNKHELWTIEGDADNYALKSEASAQYLNDQGWNTGFGGLGDGSRRKFVSLSDGKYAIQNKSNNDYVGRWQNQESAPFEMENIAANKNEAQRGNYFVYYMSKSDYATKRAAALTAATEGASASSPADLTDFIYNPRFSDLDRWGWTEGGSSGNRQFFANAAECWNNNNMTFTQTFTDLPNGKYTISVQAVNPDNGSSTGAKLVGNTVEKAIETSHSSNAYATVAAALMNDASLGLTEIDVLVTNETLELGIKAPTGWVIFDNFKLTYKGEDLSDYEAAYAAANTAAKEVDLDAPMYGVYKTALETAISTYADKTYSTVAEIQEAITALETTTTNATKSIAQYSANATALVNQKALIDGTNVYAAEGYNAYVTAYEAAKAAYDNRTANEVVVNPNAATGWHASTAYNFLLTPWTFGGEACSNFDKALDINTWSTEGDNDGSNFQVPFFEYWVADGENLQDKELAAQVTDLENGLYSVSVLVRTRAKSGVAYADATGITLSVNGGTPVDVTKGTQINTGDRAQFGVATFTAEGLVKDGVLNIKLNVKNTNVSWLAYKNVKYTKVRDLTPEEQIVYATEEEIAAFNAVVAAAEAKTPGFLAGEYAPYNNIAAFAALKAAKALDVENPIDIAVLTPAKEALENAVWTANEEEVNAIYDGGFSKTTAQSGGYLVPTGWTNLGYNTRVYNQTNKGSNAGVDAGKEGGCLFAKFTTTYGEVEGYEMPLKAGFYSLKFIYGGWNEVGTRDIKVYNAENNATVTPATVTAKNNQAHVSTDAWSQYDGVIEIPADGNYILSFYRQSTTAQNQIAISDLEIFTTTDATLTCATGKIATFCAPFDVELPEGIKAYTAEIDDETVVLTKVAQNVSEEVPELPTKLEAGLPVVVFNASDNDVTKTFTGDIEVEESLAEGDLVGLLTSTPVPAGSYVLNTKEGIQAFYQITDDAQGKLNRCYLKGPAVGAAERLTISFGEETLIEAIKQAEAGNVSEYYSVSGSKVQAPVKGINIVKMSDGTTRKIIVK